MIANRPNAVCTFSSGGTLAPGPSTGELLRLQVYVEA
jgi:hypothetical protein